MLAADALMEFVSQEYLVAASANVEPILTAVSKSEYVLAQPEIPQDELQDLSAEERALVEPVFIVETVDTPFGPKATISFNSTFADTPPGALQELTLQLRQDGRVLESYDIKIDIAEESFRKAFLADRVDDLANQLPDIAPEAEREWLADRETARFVNDLDSFIGPLTTNQIRVRAEARAELEAVEAKLAETPIEFFNSLAERQFKYSDILADQFDREYFYGQYDQLLQQLKSERTSAKTESEIIAFSEREQSLRNAALLLGNELEADLASENTNLAQAAHKLRNELVAISDPIEILFAGFSIDQEVERTINNSGDEKAISFVETGRYVFNNVLEIDVGKHQAMVQVTRSSQLRSAAATSVSESPAVEDGSIDEANPTVNGGTAVALHVDGTASAAQETLIRFNAGAVTAFDNPTTVSSAALELTEIATGVGDAEIYVWNGLLDGPADSTSDWGETNLSWNHVDGTLGLDTKLSEFTQLSDWTAGTTTDVDVTSPVQRALLYGDANGDGELAAAGIDGDIEAFHLAVTNWNAYVAEYGPRANAATDLLARTDGGLGDGTIDTADINDFFRRHGYSQGDYNLDGTVQDNQDSGINGLDWAVFNANYGLTNARFTQGDGNFDGVVGPEDFDIWFDRKSEDTVTAEEPEIILWVRPKDTTTDIEFASQENTTDGGPTLIVDHQPDLALNKFSVQGNNLVVDYAVFGEAFTNVKVQLYKAGNPDTLLHETAVQSGTLGSHEVLIATSVLSSIVEGDQIYAKVVGIAAAGTQSNTSNDQLDFEFSTAATQTVNSLDDAGMDQLLSNKHTLRELLDANESLGWFDTLTFDDASLFADGPGTITLGDHSGGSTADQLVISTDISIVGPGPDSLSISGSDQVRVLKVDTGATVALTDLTITEGYDIGSGGGIYNRGDLTLTRVNITESAVGNHGGGIYNISTATLDITSTTIDGNQATYGGGISAFLPIGQSLSIVGSTISNNTSTNHSGGLSISGTSGASPVEASIENTTFSGNSSTNYGGGIRVQTNTELTIINSTIADNTTGISAGGIFNHSGTVTLHNSLIADNTVTGSAVWAADATGNIGGTVADPSSNNIVSVSHGGHGLDGALNDTGSSSSPLDAGLTPLGDYGGPTSTHGLLNTSIAIDGSDDAIAPDFDQRGFDPYDEPNLVTGSIRDIGAYEYHDECIVNTVGDGNVRLGILTLRQAIADANMRSGVTVDFDPSVVGSITLVQGPLAIDSDMTIPGPGADLLAVSGLGSGATPGASNVFVIGSAATATVSGLTISNATSSGIRNLGDLTLDGVEIRDNDDYGLLASGNNFHILNSTIADNQGGGIYAGAYSAVNSITNSTISGNEGTGLIALVGDTVLTNVTVTDNDAGSLAGGIVASSSPVLPDYATVTLHNTIVAENRIGAAAGDLHAQAQGIFDPLSSYNLIGDFATSSSIQHNNLFNIVGDAGSGTLDPLLSPLGDHGGPTRTHALLVGSSALDKGDASLNSGFANDQRGAGFERVPDGIIDIGAYEAASNTADIIFVVDQSTSMANEHAWLSGDGVATDLEQSLATKGVLAPRFGLLAYTGIHVAGPADGTPVHDEIEIDGTSLFGTAAQFETASAAHLTDVSHGAEDGYEAINYLLNEQPDYNLRAKAQVNIVLVTDAHRLGNETIDLGLPGHADDYAFIAGQLAANNAILNVIVDRYFTGTFSPGVGLDETLVVGVADGLDSQKRFVVIDDSPNPPAPFMIATDDPACSPTVDFSDCFAEGQTGPSDPEPAANVYADYMTLAWETGGATWDINVLENTASGDPARVSFNAAFSEIKAQEIAGPGFVLQEAARLLTNDSHPLANATETLFTVPTNPEALSFDFSSLAFDSLSQLAGPDVNDAFEIAVLRPDGRSALPTIGSNSDALFNITQGQNPLKARGVELSIVTGSGNAVTEGKVEIDISSLTAGEQVRLVGRLINNDHDDGTSVLVDFDASNTMQGLHTIPSATTSDWLAAATGSIGSSLDPIDFSRLDDVTVAFDTSYTHTTFEETDTPSLEQPGGKTARIDTRISIQNAANLVEVRGELLLAITGLTSRNGSVDGARLLTSDSGDVLPVATAGLPAGTPYLRLTDLMPKSGDFYVDGGILPNDLSLLFERPDGTDNERFDFDMVFLGEFNQAPDFESDPIFADVDNRIVQIPVGNTFDYDANAIDPDDDDFYFTMRSVTAGLDFVTPDADPGPNEEVTSSDGVISWIPAAGDVNKTFDIQMRVTDEFGEFNDQSFAIHVVDALENRAPYFIEPWPVVEAYANQLYEYDATGSDPDNHTPLTYAVLPATSDELEFLPNFLDPATGMVSWIPTAAQIGNEYDVWLEVRDPLNLPGDLHYVIKVFADPENRPPVILTESLDDAILGAPYSFPIDAFDPDVVDGDAITYTLTADSTGGGITIDSSSGLLEWINPDTAAATISVRATDLSDEYDEEPYIITAQTSTPASISGYVWDDSSNKNQIKDSSFISGPDAHVIFVIDISDSMSDTFIGTPVGDFNGDGDLDRRFDAALQALSNLNDQLAEYDAQTSGEIRVSVIDFSDDNDNPAASPPQIPDWKDMNLSAGSGVPLNETDPNHANWDEYVRPGEMNVAGDARLVDEVLMNLITTGGTNFKAGLNEITDFFAHLTSIGEMPANPYVVFLSDGEDFGNPDFQGEVDALTAVGVKFRAFGVGLDADPYDLGKIDREDDGLEGLNDKAQVFGTTDELLGVFTPEHGGDWFEPFLQNWSVYIDQNNNNRWDVGEPFDVSDIDGQYDFNNQVLTTDTNYVNLAPGTYVVRQVLQDGWFPTWPTNPNPTNPAPPTVGDSSEWVINVSSGQVVDDAHFGNAIVEPLANQDPVFQSTPPTPLNNSVEIGGELTYDAYAVDPEGSDVTYHLNNGPRGSFIHPTTGHFYWAPEANQFGPHTVLITADDGDGGSDFQIFTVNATSPNIAPIFTTGGDLGTIYPIDPTDAEPGFEFVIPIRAYDPWDPGSGSDNAPVNFDWSYSNLPGGITITEVNELGTDRGFTLLISGNPTSATGTVDFAITATDDNFDSTPMNFTLQVDARPALQGPNNQPVIDSMPRTTIGIGQEFRYTIEAHDDDKDSLSISAIIPAEVGMVYIAESNTITWTPTAAHVEQYGDTFNITAIANDQRGEPNSEATQPFILTVTGAPPPNDAPIFVDKPYPGAVVDQEYRIQFEATDEDNDVVYWLLKNRSDQRMALDPFDGTFVWNPLAEHIVDQGSITVVAYDIHGDFSELDLTIPVRGINSPPYLQNFNPPSVILTNDTFSYQVEAFDIDGELGPLQYTLNHDVPTAGNANWTLTVDENGLITGQAPSSPTTNIHSFELLISDGQYQLSRFFAVDVVGSTDPIAPNDPPIFDSFPDFFPVVGGTYEYEPIIIDDGTYTLTLADGDQHGMSLSGDQANGYLVTWDTNGLAPHAFYTMKLQALDDGGITAVQEVRFLLNPAPPVNTAPTFIAPLPIGSYDAVRGSLFTLDVLATDPEAHAVFFDMIDAPTGMEMVRTSKFTGRIEWEIPANETLGLKASITLDIFDKFLLYGTSESFSINVVDDNTPPTVSLVASTNYAQVNTPVSFFISVGDNAGIKDVWLSVTAVPENLVVPVGPNYVANHVFTTAGTYTITAVATDTSDLDSLPSSVEVTIYDPAVTNLPTAQITLIDDQDDIGDDGIITRATDITFLVDNHPSLIPANVSYLFELIDISSGQTALVLDFGDGEVLPDNTVNLDPTTLPNGQYRLRLTAISEANTPVVDEQSIQIDTGQLKVGNFSLSFTDMAISVAGLPIAVTRTYDTLRRAQAGEFGQGWHLDVSNTELEIDYGSVRFPQFTKNQPFVSQRLWDTDLNPDDATRVVVTLPDGTTEGFTFEVIPEQELPFVNVPLTYVPRFVPDPGVTSELIVSTVQLLRGTDNDGVYYNGGVSYSPLSFSGGFELRTRSGLSLVIHPVTGDLYSITDRNGNTTTFTDQSIKSDSGKGVLFEYDDPINPNQITAVVDVLDPTRKVTYQYDAMGDLVKVTNRASEETTLTYDPNNPHLLDGIIDPLGVTVLHPEYDSSGKLKYLNDASTAQAEFLYETAGDLQVERILDDNKVPTEIVRDSRGNVVRSIQRLDDNEAPGDPNTTKDDDTFQITEFQYDANDNQTFASVPFRFRADEHPAPSTADDRYTHLPPDPADLVWASINKYDLDGEDKNQLIATVGGVTQEEYINDGEDVFKRGTQFRYNRFNQPWLIIDGEGNATNNVYDDAGDEATGNLLRTFVEDNQGNIISDTRFDYYPNGTLWQTRNADNEVVSSFSYNEYGELTSTTDAALFTRSFDVNDFGEVEGTSYQWTDQFTSVDLYNDYIDLPNDIGLPYKTVITSTSYDEEGRVETSTDAHGNKTTTEYDAAGRLKKTIYQLIDDSGVLSLHKQVTENFYDIRGNLVETRSSFLNDLGVLAEAEVISRTAYDNNGRAVYAVDPFIDGATVTPGTETVYDDLGRVSQTIRYEHVDIQLVVHPTFPVLRTLTMGLDDVMVANQLSSNHTYFDDAGRVQFTVDGSGLITESKYNAKGQQQESIVYLTGVLDSLTNPTQVNEEVLGEGTGSQSTLFEYDDAGRQEAVTDAKGHTTRTVYDSLGRAVKTVFHDGTVTETVYNDLGQRIGQIAQHTPQPGLDKTPLTTNYEYDISGRLVAVILPPVEDFSNPAGPLVRPRYEYEYDIYGNQVAIHDTIIHDNSGSHDATNERVTFFTFDHLGRQVARTLPEGVNLTGEDRAHRERTDYDLAGRIWRTTSFSGVTTDYIYDDLGRLDMKQFFDDGVTPDGDPGLTSNFNEITDYFYDALGRQIKVHQDRDHDGLETAGDRIAENFYDELGRLERSTNDDTVNSAINYEYNALGRLSRTFTGDVEPGSTPANIDGDGVAVTDTRYTYDRLGRLETVTAHVRDDQVLPTLETTTYDYDVVDNLEQVLRHGGVGTVYTYDDLNRLTDEINFIDEDANGIYNPDVDNGPSDVSNDDGDTLISSFRYVLRDDGKRAQAVETFPGREPAGPVPLVLHFAWDYDNAGRLISETFDYGPGQEYPPNPPHPNYIDEDYLDTFKYDLVGNRKVYNRVDPNDPLFAYFTTAYVYDTNDRIISESKIGSNSASRYTEYSYNVNQPVGGKANVKNVYENRTNASGLIDEKTISSYNLQGRLSKVEIDEDPATNPGTNSTTKYQYDDAGFRVQKDINSTVTHYLADGNSHTGHTQVLEELNATGNVQKTFLLGHDVLAQHDGTNGQVYLISDGHGSTRQLVTTAGDIVVPSGGIAQFFTYTAYGEPILFDETQAITALLYSGEWFETSIGKQYLRARYYDAASGRFNRLDPFAGNVSDPQSLHKYLYAHGDPVNMTDPTGLFGLAGFSAGFGIATSIANIKNSVDLTVFDSIATTVQGVQAGQSPNEIIGSFFRNQAIGIGIGFSVGKFVQFADSIWHHGIGSGYHRSLIRNSLGARLFDSFFNSVARSAGGRRYGMPNRIVREDVAEFTDRLFTEFKQAGGTIAPPAGRGPIRKHVVTGREGRVLASYNSKENLIVIFEGATYQDYLEELIHFRQARRDGYLGTKAPTSVRQQWEREIDNIFQNLGMTPL